MERNDNKKFYETYCKISPISIKNKFFHINHDLIRRVRLDTINEVVDLDEIYFVNNTNGIRNGITIRNREGEALLI